MGCASSISTDLPLGGGKDPTQINGGEQPNKTKETCETLDRAPSNIREMNTKSSLSGESVSNFDFHGDGEQREESSSTGNNELTRRSSAAIMIQRRARGMGARVSISKRRQSVVAENQFLKTLNPRLSPAENAANALLGLALVHAIPHPLVYPKVLKKMCCCRPNPFKCSGCLYRWMIWPS